MGNKKILLSLLTVFVVGCVPSLHRLYTDDTVVFEEELLGRWVQDDEGNVWTFTKEGDNGYNLLIRDDDKSGKFVVHLVKLEDKLFMDVFPGELESKDMLDFYAIHLIPGHTFMKMKMDDSGVELSMMNPEKVDEILKENRGLLKHEKLEDGNMMVLTASTKDLQKFILKYAETEKFFGESMELIKRKSIFKTKDAIFDKRLVGKWSHENGTVESSSVNDKYYKITAVKEDGDTEKYTAVLVKTKGLMIWALFKGDIEGDILADPEISPDGIALIEEIFPRLRIWAVEIDDVPDISGLDGEALKKAFMEQELVELEPIK